MAVQTSIKDPERIKSLEEIDDILTRITAYEEETNCRSGVLLIQNLQFGGYYMITSEKEATKEMKKPVLNKPPTVEWGIKFYPYSYFVQLRKDLEAKLTRQ